MLGLFLLYLLLLLSLSTHPAWDLLQSVALGIPAAAAYELLCLARARLPPESWWLLWVQVWFGLGRALIAAWLLLATVFFLHHRPLVLFVLHRLGWLS